MDNVFERRRAADGFYLCSYRTSRFKTLRLSFSMAVPLSDNAAQYAILPYLLSHSCKAYPDYISLSKKLAGLYGASLSPSLSKMGENLVLSLSMTAIDDRFTLHNEDMLRACAELLCQVVFEPKLDGVRFPAADVAREKRLLLERIQAEKDDKRTYALRRCTGLMCADEPYRASVYGTPEGAAALTPVSVFDAWQTALRTARIQVDVVGDVDPEEAAAAFCGRLAALNRTRLMDFHTEVRAAAGSVKRAEEQMPVQQAKLVMGYRAGMTDPLNDYPALRIMTDLFGGGTYSRLFANVREKQSLCYDCSARLRRMKGLIFVQSGIDTGNADRMVDEVQKQLAAMAAGDVTDDDVQRSVLSIADSYGTICDCPEDIDGWAFTQMCDPVFETPESTLEKLRAVTREDVIRAAGKVTLDTVFLLAGETPADDAGGEEADHD